MKLLLLGSSSVAALDIVKKAQEMGHHIIATDNSGMTAAKKVADEVWGISTAELDKLERLCVEHNVAGVISPVSAFNWRQAIKLNERLGANACTSNHVYQAFNDKKTFHSLAHKCGLPMTKVYSSPEDVEEFPVIVKPVDNCGARGISICENEKELFDGINDALAFSDKKEYIIEKYYKGEEVSVYGTIVNGEFILSAVVDRIIKRFDEMPAPKASLLRYPSKRWKEIEGSYMGAFKTLVQALNINFGVCFFQGIISNGQFHIYEGEIRLSSSQLYNIIEYYQGYNRIELMLEYTLKGWCRSIPDASNKMNGYAYVINPILKPGTVEFLNDKELYDKSWIIKYEKYVGLNEKIAEYGKGVVRFFGCIHIVADDEETLEDRLEYIKQNLIVYDEKQESLIVI